MITLETVAEVKQEAHKRLNSLKLGGKKKRKHEGVEK